MPGLTTADGAFQVILGQINKASTLVFTIVAICTGIMVANKFINSRDKKEAVHYALWWVVGIFFFYSIHGIVSHMRNAYGIKDAELQELYK
ncbi:MAG: hypothetical protein K2X94_01745 [Amoebophilaceae bacterium]|nr:hypothetical protein [Amoebophilaceae bacterium]